MNPLKLMTMLCFFTAAVASAQQPDFSKIVDYAIKAPSGHNTQPWQFKINETDIELYPDFSKTLSVVDSNRRELYISVGCALENACIAAHELGYSPVPEILAQDSVWFVRIKLKKENTPTDPLFLQLDKRQTNRNIYLSKLISADTVARLQKAVYDPAITIRYYRNGEDNYQTLAQLVARGNEIQYTDKAYKKELTNWIRFNAKEVRQHEDGLAYNVLGSPSMPGWLGKVIVRKFLSPRALNKSDQRKINTSSHFVLFSIRENTPVNWIRTGQALERFFLTCTELGIAVSFSNQVCEVPALTDELKMHFDLTQESPMLLLRIGYAGSVPYSVRKKPETMLRH